MSLFPAGVGGSASLWKLISKVELGTPAASISLSGIDTKYKAFRTYSYLIEDGTSGIVLNTQFNGDTAANYAMRRGLASSTTLGVASFSVGMNQMACNINDVTFGRVMAMKPLATEMAAAITDEAEAGGSSDQVLQIHGGRWANTVDLIDEVTVTSAENMDGLSVMVVEGAEF